MAGLKNINDARCDCENWATPVLQEEVGSLKPAELGAQTPFITFKAGPA